MNIIKKQTIALFLVLVLAGCSTAKLEELRQLSPRGSALNIALAREYLALSDAEAQNYDWVDSYLFADKGLRAAYNHSVAPENPHDWDIEGAPLKELVEARSKLTTLLGDKALAENQAMLLARTQYFYDCWVEQQEESWQVEDIAECKEGFYSNLTDLEGGDNSPTPLMRTTAYMVFFNRDEDVITPEGREVLLQVVGDLKNFQNSQVLLHGHTDSSGAEDYNMSLSERRADAVKQLLSSEGISDKKISYFAFGETDLRVKTADGVREPANRRVEIFLE